MQHFDEHTLEMYVLGTKAIAGRREEIERHLAHCHGCRGLVEEMRFFYREADKAVEEVSREDGKAEKALVRAKQALTPLYADAGPLGPAYRPVTAMQRFQYFVRRHPVVVGSGMLACSALIMLALFYFPANKPAWREPHRVFPNFQTGLLEVYDSNDSLLWGLPSQALRISTDPAEDLNQLANLMAATKIADIDGDGRNEILIVLPLWEESAAESLRVFKGDRGRLWAAGFEREAPHRSRHYEAKRFHPGSLVIIPKTGSDQSDVYVACGLDFSPTFIVHLDSRGNELGTYWHHGHCKIRTVDMNRNGKQEILLYGIDDTNEGKGTEFPFLAIVDPAKIVGDEQSTATPVYRLGLSDAEEFYLGFPLTDMHLALKTNAGLISFNQETDSTFSVDARGSFKESDSFLPHLKYYLNRRLEVEQVKSNNPTDRMHARLRREGKITSVMGPEYLELLRRGVRFWDGKAWREKPTPVSHSTEVVTEKK